MRSYIKILCLLCALLMVVSCFTACKVKVKPESLTDKEALTEYEKLTNNMDKLFYFADEKHPAASNVTSIIGEIEKPDADININKLEASVAASLDKLTIGGADYLQQLGGPQKDGAVEIVTAAVHAAVGGLERHICFLRNGQRIHVAAQQEALSAAADGGGDAGNILVKDGESLQTESSL